MKIRPRLMNRVSFQELQPGQVKIRPRLMNRHVSFQEIQRWPFQVTSMKPL